MVELGGGMTKCVQITTAADTLDWSSAKESCESQGGHLITFKSKTESVLFGDYLFAQGMQFRYLSISLVVTIVCNLIVV